MHRNRHIKSSLTLSQIKQYGIGTLWYGALATAAATFVGHYPWFGTYNFLQDNLPEPEGIGAQLLRQAFIGFVASIVSDTVSNSLRVIKTYRQVHQRRVGYMEAAEAVIAADGLKGLFGRGLKTRILANGLQGLMFSVLWKLFLKLYVLVTKALQILADHQFLQLGPAYKEVIQDCFAQGLSTFELSFSRRTVL